MSTENGSSKTRISTLQTSLLAIAGVIGALATLVASVGELRDGWCRSVGLFCAEKSTHIDPEKSTNVDFANAKPILRSPDDGAQFNNFPRTYELVWNPVPGASAYKVELQMQVSGPVPNSVQWISMSTATVSANNFSSEFNGATWGRWRITAVNLTGEESQQSDWRTFRFNQ
jgi:hypothetical protein